MGRQIFYILLPRDSEFLKLSIKTASGLARNHVGNDIACCISHTVKLILEAMESKPLWQHQLDAIALANNLPEFALFFDMGTGKTRTTIEILRHKYNLSDQILKTLILCPLIVTQNWPAEFLKFSKIPEHEVCVLNGTQTKRLELLEKSRAHIFIMNYEGLLMEPLFSKLISWGVEILVCDESQKLKNITAKRTKKAILLAEKTSHRYLLSGTPILNSPMDIFSQYRILDNGKTFGKNFYIFRGQYFYDKNSGMPAQKHFPDWKIKSGAVDSMNKLIYTKAMRVKKEDCLDLPPLVKQTILTELAPTQQRLYAQMKKDFITFVQNMGKMEASVATLAITKALRLLQIVSGFIKTEDGNEITLADTPKLAALKELLEELAPNHKVLVWAVFKENYVQIKRICEEAGIGYVEVHGGISEKQKFEAVENFNQDEKLRVFIGHPGSGGIGINLVAASYSIFYSRNFSLEQDVQAEARNYRGGSEIHTKVTRIDLVVKDTIDELVQISLANKVEIGELMLRSLASQL